MRGARDTVKVFESCFHLLSGVRYDDDAFRVDFCEGELCQLLRNQIPDSYA